MFDEFDGEEDNWRPEKPLYRRIISKFFKIGFVVLVVGIIGFMTARLFMSKPPKSVKELTWTESAVKEQETLGKDFIYEHILVQDSFSHDGLFSVDAVMYIPSSKELQMTVRFNNRVYKHLYREYPEAEKTDGEKFVFAMRDNLGNEYHSYVYGTDSKMGYSYRRLIFKDVDFEDVSGMYLDVYYAKDVDSGVNIRETMNVYKFNYEKIIMDSITPEKLPFELKEYNPDK